MNDRMNCSKERNRNSACQEDRATEHPGRPDAGESVNANGYTERHIHSAGGIAFRIQQKENDCRIQVALIATDRACRRWQLPKGRLYPSEGSLAAALREVEEETGLETEFETFLKTVKYQYFDTYARAVPEKVHKKVDFYLLRVVGGRLSDQSVEVQKVEWTTAEEALARLAYDGERDCLALALEYLNGH